ncbi:MAG: Smr/MutS family protein, partial [Kiritimatiellae bacterium]|nr:Smr/MutS family protein [Kiritimatiellia bacterium]
QTVDIEAGLPTVDEALAKFDRALYLAQQNGTPLLRVVHGWGSSTGGSSYIRPALRRHLADLADRALIRSFLPGDRYSHAFPDGLALLRRHPVLRLTEPSDRLNPGITFVEP